MIFFEVWTWVVLIVAALVAIYVAWSSVRQHQAKPPAGLDPWPPPPPPPPHRFKKLDKPERYFAGRRIQSGELGHRHADVFFEKKESTDGRPEE